MVAQIVGQGFADIGRERKRVVRASLPRTFSTPALQSISSSSRAITSLALSPRRASRRTMA